MRGPDGKVVRAQYVLTDGTVDVGGRVVAQDERKGIVLRRIDGPLRQVSRRGRPLPAGHLVGRDGHVHAARLPRRVGRRSSSQSDPSLFTKPTTVVASVDGREVGADEGRADGDRGSCACRSARTARLRVRFTSRRRRSRGSSTKGQNPDPRELGVALLAFTYRPLA